MAFPIILRYALLLTFDNMLSALAKNYQVFADFSSEILFPGKRDNHIKSGDLKKRQK